MLPRSHRVDTTFLALLCVALALVGLAWRQGGPARVWEGLARGGALLLWVAPLLLAAFLVAGFVQVLVSPRWVERWLGAGSGWRGILLACIGGALIPGGPYAYYPVAAVLLRSGASLGVLVAFVVAKNLYSGLRIPLEVALLGPRLTLLRLILTLWIPPLMGVLAESLFGARVQAIREAMGP